MAEHISHRATQAHIDRTYCGHQISFVPVDFEALEREPHW